MLAGGQTTLLYLILHRLGFDAWAAAAGFQSIDEAMSSPGTGLFLRTAMLTRLEEEARRR